MKLGSPDYTDCNTEEAIQDFMKRIKCYENSYQPLDENLDRLEIQFHLFPNVFHPSLNITSYYLCTLYLVSLMLSVFLQRVVIH